MRTLFLLMNISLDGYFEGPGNDLSGFTMENEAFSRDGNHEMDTLLLGRKTYDMMASFWPTPQAAEMMPEVAKYMNETRKVVASHRDFAPDWQNTRGISGDVMEQVRQLKAEPGKAIGIFGSNTLCVSLIQAGLLDEMQILVNPVLLGAGTPLFEGLGEKIPFTLTNTHPFQTGSVLLTYKPA